MKKVHKDKEDAFRETARLRERIERLKVQGAEEYQQVVELANRDGDQAAVQFARDKASTTKKKKSSMFPQVSYLGCMIVCITCVYHAHRESNKSSSVLFKS